MNREQFLKITELVIDRLEGGYYHPDMLSDGRVKDKRYIYSGETMFGLDRRAGWSLYYTKDKAGKVVFKSAEAKEFWESIDKANARKLWKWNYRGGALETRLKRLAAEIMLGEYERLAKLYLSEKARAIVAKDSRLLFNFVYATWNGAGWFRKFATDLNKAVESGITNPDKLVQVALNSRTQEGLKSGSAPNSLIVQTGRKIANLFKEVQNLAPVSIWGLIAALGTGVYIWSSVKS